MYILLSPIFVAVQWYTEVWSVAGNIEYSSRKHLVLVVFSTGVLVLGLAYPILVLCAPLLEKYSYKCIPHRLNFIAKFKPLLDAYGGPYKDKYRFWTGVTLLVRLSVFRCYIFLYFRKIGCHQRLHHYYCCSGYFHILVIYKRCV